MAARPGEENVATLFADVHYFYGPETEIPTHHRFDKGSYVYLFENAHEGRARIEVANHPGSEHQDAFDGFLDRTAVKYSYKHSCMVNLTVGDVPNQDEWHLPTYDPTNQNIYHYKLYSVDIYFWTHLDALQFVNGVRRVLPASQVDVQDEPAVIVAAPPPPPPPPPAQVQQTHASSTNMSSVVQRLENVALTGANSGSTGSPAGEAVQRSGAVPVANLSFAPPPLSTVSAEDSLPQQEAAATTQSPPVPPSGASPAPAPAPAPAVTQTFAAPFAYNPAAPAAPETIRPREKTPPPDDIAGHNPLHQTLYQDAATPFSPGLVVPMGLGPLSPGIPPPSFQHPPGAPSFPAPPVYTNNPPQTYQHFPQHQQIQAQTQVQTQTHPGLSRASTMPMPSTVAPSSSPFNPAANYPAFSPPPTSGTAPPPSAAAGVASPPTNTSSPAGSNYSYSNPVTSAAPGGAVDYSVHQQHYRPSPGESHSGPYQAKQDPRGKLEETAGRLEKGVSGMLKKFEKRFG